METYDLCSYCQAHFETENHAENCVNKGRGKTMETQKITRSLFIEGREWFDKVNGNSYFSARIWVDGEIVGVLPFQYGYGSQYEYEAQKWLLANDYLPQFNKSRGLWSIAEEMGFDLYSVKSFVNKRDMFTPSTYAKVGA